MMMIIFLFNIIIIEFTSACLIPTNWYGKWYQQKDAEFTLINQTSFLNKGICLQYKHEKYLFYEEKEHCYRCVFVMQKHANVLQYRTTYCSDTNDFDANCELLTPESEFNTVYRESNTYENCALNGVYKEGKSEYCHESSSYLMECVDKSMLKLKFNKCLNKSSLTLNCVAHWNEESVHYLIGKTPNNQYKCLVYSYNDKNVQVSLANDEFCRHTDNLIEDLSQSSLNLIKIRETHNRIDETCRFPKWLNRKWTSINDQNKLFYLENNKFDTLVIQTKSSRNQLNCMRLIDTKRSSLSVVVKSLNGCSIGYQCLNINVRSDFVLEFKFGKMSYDESVVDCNSHEGVIHHELVYVDTSFGITCPFSGNVYRQSKYPLSETPACKFTTTQTQVLQIGCLNDQQYSLRTSLCYPNRGLSKVSSTSNNQLYTQLESEINLVCLAYWPFNTNDNYTLLLVSRSMSNEIICSIWSLNASNGTLDSYEIDKNCMNYHRKRLNMKRLTHEFKFQSTCNEQIKARPLSNTSYKMRSYVTISWLLAFFF